MGLVCKLSGWLQLVISWGLKSSKMSHQRSYSQWCSFNKKKNQRRETKPINRSVWFPWECATTYQFTALFHMYSLHTTKLLQSTIPLPKSVFRSLVSDCFVFLCGTAFCFYHTAKKTLRVYGALVHIAPLFVCLAVSKDACWRLFVIISRLYDLQCNWDFSFTENKKYIKYSFSSN